MNSNKEKNKENNYIYIKPGIPKIRSYNNLLESELFKEINTFSNNFLKTYKKLLSAYKWSKNPLHHWSRRWEYIFVYKYVLDYLDRKKLNNTKILDAGSGFTFFPYFLSEKINNPKIYCCDYDQDLLKMFQKMRSSKVLFKFSDIKKTPYNDEYFNVIYCISVLEHTNEYEKIIKEFERIIKSDGLLIITFDISLDGSSDMPIHKVLDLLKILKNYFKILGIERDY